MIRLSWIAAAASVLSLAAAGYFALQSEPKPEPPFAIAPEDNDLGTIPLGIRTVTFTITNPADRPRRILGLEEECWNTVCFLTKHPRPVTVPAGGSYDYDCELDVKRPGPFEARVKIYLEDGGIRTAKLMVRGTGAETGSTSNGPVKP